MSLKIMTQRTPNPNALKYILNQDIKREGKVTFTDVSECGNVEMAASLLRIPHVSQIHFFENVITVTQDGLANWTDFDTSVKDAITFHIEAHDPGFEVVKENKREGMAPELIEIEDILDRTIRPGLQADGGDVQVIQLEGDILTIHYEGACGTCPSATMGTLQAIEGILQDEYRSSLEVVAI